MNYENNVTTEEIASLDFLLNDSRRPPSSLISESENKYFLSFSFFIPVPPGVHSRPGVGLDLVTQLLTCLFRNPLFPSRKQRRCENNVEQSNIIATVLKKSFRRIYHFPFPVSYIPISAV